MASLSQDEPTSFGEAFQAKTRYGLNATPNRELDWANRPALYKFYPDATVVALPDPKRAAVKSVERDLWACVRKRRSVRAYSSRPVTLEQLSSLLWASAGITAPSTRPEWNDFLRAAPSAGALYPIETYLVVNNVEDLEPGLYHYRPTAVDALEQPIADGGHALETLVVADLGPTIKRAACEQPMCAKAGVVFVWTAVFPRCVWKYRDAAYRYVYLDAGHIAANLSLAAVSLGLDSCQIAAFDDDEVNAILEIDGVEESVLYMSAVGHSTPTSG